MDSAPGEALDDAVLRQRHIGKRGIVREHRDDHLSMTGISNAACLACTQFEQRAPLLEAAVEHGDIVSGSHEVRRHRRTHAAQTDESNLHCLKSVVMIRRDRCTGSMNSVCVRQGKLAIGNPRWRWRSSGFLAGNSVEVGHPAGAAPRPSRACEPSIRTGRAEVNRPHSGETGCCQRKP